MTDKHVSKNQHYFSKSQGKGRENRINKKKRKEKSKQEWFRVYPVTQLDWKNPARIALVYWRGRGEPIEYRLDHLDNHEIRSFWSMDYAQKAEYLRGKFNRHHRRPRCQKGPTIRENLSQVDIHSHTCYNKLISAVACWAGITIEKVKTADISKFLRKVYPHLKRIMSHEDTEKLKGIDTVIDQRHLKDLSPVLIVAVARWSKVRSQSVHFRDVCRFLEYMYPALKRLAFDYVAGKLKTLAEFFKILNEIWLPIDEQIKIGRH